MAWVFIKALTVAGASLKALGKVSHFTGIVDNFSSSTKKVTLFKLGDWIRLKVGDKSYVTKKKTLTRCPSNFFSELVAADRINAAIPKWQMMKMRLMNKMNITVTPSTGKIRFGKWPKFGKKAKEKEAKEEKERAEKEEQEREEKVREEKEAIAEKEKDKEVDRSTADDQHRGEGRAEVEGAEEGKAGVENEGLDSAIQKQKKIKKEKFEKDQDGFWMIDRDPKHFPTILNYLRTGKVIASEAELEELLPEAEFYQILPLVEHLKHTLLERRRKKERKKILEVDLKYASSVPYFVVPYTWVQAWKQFAYEDSDPPSQIDNSKFLSEDRKPMEGKVEGKDFIFVNSEVWMTWWDIYGGGPTIARKTPDLYSPNVLSTLWDMTRENPATSQNGVILHEPPQKETETKPDTNKDTKPGTEKESKPDTETTSKSNSDANLEKESIRESYFTKSRKRAVEESSDEIRKTPKGGEANIKKEM